MNEECLHKTGLRGRKCYIMYGVLTLLGVVVITNFLVSLNINVHIALLLQPEFYIFVHTLQVTCTLLSVLHLGKNGMEGLEFLPSVSLLRFLGNGDMNEALVYKNVIQSQPNSYIEVSGIHDNPVSFVGKKIILHFLS